MCWVINKLLQDENTDNNDQSKLLDLPSTKKRIRLLMIRFINEESLSPDGDIHRIGDLIREHIYTYV